MKDVAILIVSEIFLLNQVYSVQVDAEKIFLKSHNSQQDTDLYSQQVGYQ